MLYHYDNKENVSGQLPFFYFRQMNYLHALNSSYCDKCLCSAPSSSAAYPNCNRNTPHHPQFRMSSGFMTRFSIIIIIYTLLINLWIGCLLTFLLLVISRLEKIPAWSSSWWEKEHHTGGSESYREERKRGKEGEKKDKEHGKGSPGFVWNESGVDVSALNESRKPWNPIWSEPLKKFTSELN